MRLAASALGAGLLYLVVALTGLGATALAHPAPRAILLAGQGAATQPPATTAAAPTTTPPVPTPREVSVGRPVQVVPASPRPGPTELASPNPSIGNPPADDTPASPAPTQGRTQGEALLPGVADLLTPVLPDVTATSVPSPVPVPTPTSAPSPSPSTPGLLGGLLGRS